MKQKHLVAVILAGGEGKRFWPIVTGKSVVQLFGKTILEHNLESLRLSGVTRSVIITNLDDEPIVKSFEIPGMAIEIVVQERPTGMADALLLAKDIIGNRPILIMNAVDIVDTVLFEGLFKEMNDHDALVVGKRVASYFPGGYLTIQNDRLAGIVEKPGAGREPSDLVNLVFHYFPDPTEFLSAIASTQSNTDDVYEKALTSYATGHAVRVVAYTGPWQPVKYSWQILDAMNILLESVGQHKGADVVIKKNVIIEGPVYIEDGVKIFENTKIVGPCYIGKNTIIGNNCIVRASHIGADCVVGFNSDITRSYIGDNCWFHSNYIGDSVLEGNISMGSGAALANLRLDDGEIAATGRHKLGAMIGAGVRVGVNASIMPGVKIGKNSFVGSGVILDKDLPDDSFCIAKPGYTVSKNLKKAPTSREEFKKKI